MSELEKEFNKLCKKLNVKCRLLFDRQYLNQEKLEAGFNHYWRAIILKDRRMCRRRLYTMLHELCHVKQLAEGRYLFKAKPELLYNQEIEAELFAIDEYERRYAKKFGTCLYQKWDLAPFDEYLRHFKTYTNR
jgi:Zn-dependent peptidase ImmA (M78 family)